MTQPRELDAAADVQPADLVPAPPGWLAPAVQAAPAAGPAPRHDPVSAPGVEVNYRGESVPMRIAWWCADRPATVGPWVWLAGVFAAASAGYLLHKITWTLVIAAVVCVVVWYVGVERKPRKSGKPRRPRRLETVDEVAFSRRVAAFSAGWMVVAAGGGPAQPGVIAAGAAGAAYGAFRYRRLLKARRARYEPAPYLPEPEPEPEPVVVEEPDDEVIDGVVLTPEEMLADKYRGQLDVLAGRSPALKFLAEVGIADVAIYGMYYRSLRLQLVGGVHTFKTIEQVKELLGTGLRTADGGPLRIDALALEQIPEDATQVLVHIREQDPLKDPVLYSEVEGEMPTTIRESLVLGRLPDRSLALLPLLGNNVIVAGTTGGGKSNTIHTILAGLARCKDVIIWMIDKKGGRAAGPWLPRVDWLATDLDEAKRMLTAYKAVIEYRTANFDLTKDKHVPTVAEPAIVLIIDETAEVIGSQSPERAVLGPLVESCVALCRSSAMPMVLATQWPDLNSIYSNKVRTNCKVSVCHQMTDALGGAFTLGKDAWRRLNPTLLEYPGAFYMRVGKSWPSPGRTPHMTPPKPGDIDDDGNNDLVHAIAVAGARTAPVLDAGSAREADRVTIGGYSSRAARLQPMLRRTWLTSGSYGGVLGTPRTGVPAVLEGGPGHALEGGPSGGVPAVPAGGSPAHAQGGPGGVPEGGPRGGSEGGPDAAAGGVSPYDVEGVLVGSPAVASEGGPEVRVTSGRWAELVAHVPTVADDSMLTEAQRVTFREQMARRGMDDVLADAFGRAAALLADAPESGAKKSELVLRAGMGDTFWKLRLRRLVALGMLFQPGGVQGRYAAGPGVAADAIVAALWEIQRDLTSERRAVDRMVEASSS